MIEPQIALDMILQRVHVLPAESLPWAQANGFCLARDVRADRDLPHGTRHEHIPVKVTQDRKGTRVTPISFRGSADLPAGMLTDGVVILPREKRNCRAGCLVAFRSWRLEP